MELDKYHKTVSIIISLLKESNAWFETFEHEPVRTSEEAAQVRTGYSLNQGAKALILRIKKSGSEKYFAQFVLPGGSKLDSKVIADIVEAKNIRFASKDEINKITDGIEIGGIPPFGNLFNIPVYVDKSLLDFDKIIFNAGDRSFSIGMKTDDYLKIVKPIIKKFS